MDDSVKQADLRREMAACGELLKQVTKDVGSGPFLKLDITWASDNYYIPHGSLGEFTKAFHILQAKTNQDSFTLLSEILAAQNTE